MRISRGETSPLDAALLPPSSKTGRACRFAPQTSRLSFSSTPRLIKVADIRLLRGKSLDTCINLLSTNILLVLSRGYFWCFVKMVKGQRFVVSRKEAITAS